MIRDSFDSFLNEHGAGMFGGATELRGLATGKVETSRTPSPNSEVVETGARVA